MARQKAIDWTKPGKAAGPTPGPPRFGKNQKIRYMVQYGPEELQLVRGPDYQSGPGEPPLGFVGGTTSKTEWYVYWALEKLLGPEGVTWTFQEAFAGGRHIPGGAVLDFVVYTPKYRILIRVQTWRFHLGGGGEKIALDLEQKINLFTPYGEELVIDIYEQYFLWDKTGKAVLDVVQDAINGIEWPSPISTGLAGDW